MKFGQLHAVTLCHYTSFAKVVGDLFSSSDKPEPLVKGEYTDLAAAPSFESAIAGINRALNFG